MSRSMPSYPVVMSIGPHDPIGGSGLSAAIETLCSLGCHCSPVVTSLIAADTRSEKDHQSTDTTLLIEQMRAVLEDIPVDLFNVGPLPSVSHIETVHTVLADYPSIPVILLPDITPREQPELAAATLDLLLPQATITLLSERQILQYAPAADSPASAAKALQEFGADDLFLMQVAGFPGEACNQWYSRRGLRQQYRWPHLPDIYDGANSTLAAAISGYLAHGISLAEALQQAQVFTQQALKTAHRLGMGKLIPNRMHWCKK